MRLSCLGLRGLLFAGAGLGLLALRTPDVRAWVLSGDSLALAQRDVRVYDNFTDASANSNTTADPSFPGFVGAPLALWKGAVEWSSELHGDGNGDPQQPLGLGSGGANFDASWQGLAAGVGGVDDNIMSEISGSGGGVVAFTETPTSDGWRIRFYAAQIWFDDPAKTLFLGSERDLQGIATHEYGHALGLGHSSDPNATMSPVVLGGGLAWRTIESDDVAGIQAIYGAKSALKPHVASYALPAPGMLLVRGSNFAAGSNEVWFTGVGTAGDGTPVIASGLASSAGGTEILLAIPAAAGPGDLLVHVPGQAYDTLSNPFPFDLNGPPCVQPVPYGNAKISSTGSPGTIGWTGQPSATTNSLELTLFGPPPGESAVLYWGLGQQVVPFLGGELLVSRPFHRAGTVTIDIFGSAIVPVTSDPSLVGTTRYYQFWYGDSADPFGAGTSDALAVTFCP